MQGGKIQPHADGQSVDKRVNGTVGLYNNGRITHRSQVINWGKMGNRGPAHFPLTVLCDEANMQYRIRPATHLPALGIMV